MGNPHCRINNAIIIVTNSIRKTAICSCGFCSRGSSSIHSKDFKNPSKLAVCLSLCGRISFLNIQNFKDPLLFILLSHQYHNPVKVWCYHRWGGGGFQCFSLNSEGINGKSSWKRQEREDSCQVEGLFHLFLFVLVSVACWVLCMLQFSRIQLHTNHKCNYSFFKFQALTKAKSTNEFQPGQICPTRFNTGKKRHSFLYNTKSW